MEVPVTTEEAAPAPAHTIVGVRFMPVGKIYHFDATRVPDVRVDDWVIVNTARGKQMGQVAAIDPPKQTAADGPLKVIERLATNRDLALKKYWETQELGAMVSGRELFRFEAYHFERSTYEQVLHGAGFTDVRWHPLRLDPAGEAAVGAGYWAEYLGNPPVVGLTCRRDAPLRRRSSTPSKSTMEGEVIWPASDRRPSMRKTLLSTTTSPRSPVKEGSPSTKRW